MLLICLLLAAGFYYAESGLSLTNSFLNPAEARLGRPATPVSYAGVARRTTVRVATPGVGSPGVGVIPGRGVGVNAGGPVNRVGVR